MSEKAILSFEASKKAMSQFSDDEKAVLMMDMTQNLFEAHKMRHEAEQELEQLRAFKQEALELIKSVAAVNHPSFLEDAEEASLAEACIKDTKLCREFLLKHGEK